MESSAEVMRKALAAGPFSLRHLAESAGLKYQTVRTWAAGLNEPRTLNVRQVAGALRKKGEELEKLAGELELAANRDDQEAVQRGKR
jgi:hypothetical protein